MGKALMVYSASLSAIASGVEINLFGATTVTQTAEVNAQYSATQEATFSLLGRNITSGGSGTNNCRFRESGADGAMLASGAGTGVVEDAVNTDLVEAGNLFNLAITDDGTNPVYAWAKANVSFSSGHGCFHSCARYPGNVFDVASSTRFVSFSGKIQSDGTATQANAEMKIYAYDTFAAMQVRATANARTNDSVFGNSIDGSSGTASITFGAGVTGLITDTAIGDAITSGQVVCGTVTLLTGVEDLTVTLVGATFTSSTNKSEVCLADTLGEARPASATADYFPVGGGLESFGTFTDANARVKVGFTATASNLRCYLSANTYTVNGTLKLMVNGSAALTTTITLLGGAGWYVNTSDTVALAATDEISYEFDEGTTGDITLHTVMVTLEDTTSAATFKRFLTLLGAGS